MTIEIPFFRTPYNYDTAQASDLSGCLCEDESLAQQHSLEETDINTIVARFGLTGKMPDSPVMPTYGDFTGIQDFQSALNAVIEAQDHFMELPADVRARFHNDPQDLLSFVANPENAPEARRLGLLKAIPGEVLTHVIVAGTLGADGKVIPPTTVKETVNGNATLSGA